MKLDSGNPRPGGTFLVLILVALAPAACVLWFMGIAMRNERLAVQQRLSDVYLTHIASVQRQLTTFWRDRQNTLDSIAHSSPVEIFAHVALSNLADSAVIYDATGKALYPQPSFLGVSNAGPESLEWVAARELEFQRTNYYAAAEAYGRIARSAPNASQKAKASQSQAGCLIKVGRKLAAVEILTQLASDTNAVSALSDPGALIVPNAQLLLLKLINEASQPVFRATLHDLSRRLNDYRDPNLSANQRRFLMEELRVISAGAAQFPTLAAERLAVEFLDHNPDRPAELGFQATPLKGVLCLASTNRTVVGLFRVERVRSELDERLRELSLAEASFAILQPGQDSDASSPLPPQEIGDWLPGWRLALQFKGGDPFEAAASRQARFYLWTGLLVAGAILLLAILAARFVSAQMRLARLKNDLVSTVSHELKTPLASMRALVDTLIAGRYRDEAQLQNYLALAAKENQRLTHLIDNFLSFSRMEQGKRQFRFDAVQVDRIVQDAAEAMQDRLQAPICRFEMEVAKGLPAVRADSEALKTVLINLLDNAWKYTETNKQITLRAFRDNGTVCLQVQDNGIGLTPSEAKRVFDRFYQVDQSLSRKRGGCGLGLSIVQSIVRGHAGSVQVESDPGKGSIFSVRLPIPGETE